MSIDMDDEILQDFLVEAGEILELLSEQLVDLEQQPDDYDLLNAVFRGFHTIKGGAGFLKLESLVNVCHRAEDVFNVLRQGQRSVDATLMDAVLQVLDIVNEMFASVQAGEEPEHADPELLATLKQLAEPAAEEEAEEATVVEESEPVANDPALTADDEITEEEFEALLDQLHGDGKHSGTPPAAGEVTQKATAGTDTPSGDITEDEFDDLLDQLHGKGQFGGLPAPEAKEPVEKKSQTAPISSDDISEDEFDALLDELHGKGKFSGLPASTQTASTEPQNQSKAIKSSKPSKPKPAKPAAKKSAAKKSAAKAPVAETTIRVDTARLDNIMNMVGELVLVRNRLTTLKDKLGDEEVANAVANLDVVTGDLQNSVMKTRMQPVKKVFGRFPRVVRDLARTMKKEIDLEMEGEDTDLDKNLVEALSDPMVHLVRNSVDHGIEMPDQRERLGKPRRGRILLTAGQKGDHIILSISDDGKGMDPEVLRGLAVEKGMMDEEAAARLDDRDCFNLIFQAGFSTKKEISDVSGRGVGMDVVKTRIAQMNGAVEIDSELGSGSTITIKLPLTLAILPTLMVLLGKQPFALPLASVVEIFNLDLSRTNVVDGQLTILVRGRALPLFYLHKWLVQDNADFERDGMGHVVVVNVANKHIGLVVDNLVGQEEVVIKPLGSQLQGLDGMAGATITGDGKIALILDVPGLMRKYVQ